MLGSQLRVTVRLTEFAVTIIVSTLLPVALYSAIVLRGKVIATVHAQTAATAMDPLVIPPLIVVS